MSPKQTKTPCQEVRELRTRYVPHFRPYWDAMENEANFLSGARYKRDSASHNKDRRRVQIRGQEIQDTIRHVVAKITEKRWEINARPVDGELDPENSEAAVAIIEHELGDPRKGFRREFYEAVQASCEVRLGVVWMDLDTESRPYKNEIYFGREDGKNFLWDTSRHPHHPLNRFLIRQKRVHPDDANRLYGVNWVQPDRMAAGSNNEWRNIPLMDQKDAAQIMAADDEMATIWECWYKCGYGTPKKRDSELETEQELPEDERYLLCASCGYRSDPQGSADFEYPEMSPQSCPVCMGDMTRMDVKALTPEEAAQMEGKGLVIMAPYSPSPKDDPLYEGAWPVPTARSYPGLFITRYVDPGKPIGKSDTYWMWDQQFASDNLRTQGVQSVFAHQPTWVLPYAGLVDRKGQRYAMRDDQSNIAFKDMTKAALGPLTIDRYEGMGLDPNWLTVFQTTQDALTRYRPQLDVGSSEKKTKNIPVGTIERITSEAEVSTEDFRRRIQWEMGPFAGVLWDYIKATYTDEKTAVLNFDGVDVPAAIHGDSLAGFNFVIEDTPEFSGLEEQRMQAANWAMQTLLNPMTAPYFDILADINKIPKSIVKKIQKRQQEQAMAAALAPPMDPMGEDPMADPMMGGGGDEAMGGGFAGGPPPDNMMNGVAPDAGMVPAF